LTEALGRREFSAQIGSNQSSWKEEIALSDHSQCKIHILNLKDATLAKDHIVKLAFLYFSNSWDSNLNYLIKYLLWTHPITHNIFFNHLNN